GWGVWGAGWGPRRPAAAAAAAAEGRRRGVAWGSISTFRGSTRQRVWGSARFRGPRAFSRLRHAPSSEAALRLHIGLPAWLTGMYLIRRMAQALARWASHRAWVSSAAA